MEQPQDLIDNLGELAKCLQCNRVLDVNMDNNGTEENPVYEPYYALCNHKDKEEEE